MGTEASGKQEVMKRGYSGKTPGRDGCLKSSILCQKVAEPEWYLVETKECPACRVSLMGAGNNYKLLNDKLVTNLKINVPYRIERLVMAPFIMLASTSWSCCPPFHQGWASQDCLVHSSIARHLLPLRHFSDTNEWKLLVSFLFDLSLPPSLSNFFFYYSINLFSFLLLP